MILVQQVQTRGGGGGGVGASTDRVHHRAARVTCLLVMADQTCRTRCRPSSDVYDVVNTSDYWARTRPAATTPARTIITQSPSPPTNTNIGPHTCQQSPQHTHINSLLNTDPHTRKQSFQRGATHM